MAKLSFAYLNICFIGPVDTGINFITSVSVCFFLGHLRLDTPSIIGDSENPHDTLMGPGAGADARGPASMLEVVFQSPIGLRVI